MGGEALFAPLNVLELVESRWAGHNGQVTEANVRSLDLANGGGNRQRFAQAPQFRPVLEYEAGRPRMIAADMPEQERPRFGEWWVLQPALRRWPLIDRGRLYRLFRPLNQIDRGSFRFRYFRHGCSSLTATADDESLRFSRAAAHRRLSLTCTRRPTTGSLPRVATGLL